MSRLFWIAVGAALGIAATILRSHDHVTPADPDEGNVATVGPASHDTGGFVAPG